MQAARSYLTISFIDYQIQKKRNKMKRAKLNHFDNCRFIIYKIVLRKIQVF